MKILQTKTAWVFDLDNILYLESTRLLNQIDIRICSFVMNLLNIEKDEAHKIQKDSLYEHGTTLSGLMNKH